MKTSSGLSPDKLIGICFPMAWLMKPKTVFSVLNFSVSCAIPPDKLYHSLYGSHEMSIWVDADATPGAIKEIILRAADRTGTPDAGEERDSALDNIPPPQFQKGSRSFEQLFHARLLWTAGFRLLSHNDPAYLGYYTSRKSTCARALLSSSARCAPTQLVCRGSPMPNQRLSRRWCKATQRLPAPGASP